MSDDIIPRHVAHLLLGLATLSLLAAGALGLSGPGVPLGDDNSSHLAEIARVAQLISEGRSDFWFDQTNLGYPLFVAYQPAPALLMGTLAALTAGVVPILTLFKASLALLWTLIPLAGYLGGRWLGFSRLEALLFGLLAIAISDWRAFGLSLASIASKGLYTQAYGMVLLPLAVGATYRHILGDGKTLLRASLLTVATLLCHVFFALYLFLATAIMVVLSAEQIKQRARAATIVLAIAAGLTAFWWLPFASNIQHQSAFPFGGAARDGYPLVRATSWLMGGRFFDHDRLPWLTMLVIAGGVVCWTRRRLLRERFVLCFSGAAFVLFLGRNNLGWLYDLIPFHRELEVFRYVGAIHFCGVAFAAIALARLLSAIKARLERTHLPRSVSPDRVMLLVVLAISTLYISHRAHQTHQSLRTYDHRRLELPKLAKHLEHDHNGRFVVHRKLKSGSALYRNLLPLLSQRPQLQSYARGYHDTASLYYLEFFGFKPHHYRLFNVQAVVSRGPKPKAPPGYLRTSFSDKHHKVFAVSEAFGYFDFVRTPIALLGDRDAQRPIAHKMSDLFDVRVLPLLGAAGSSGAESWPADNRHASDQLIETLRDRYQNQPVHSRVLGEHVESNSYAATVDVQATDERLLLKVSFHPYWQATVDGHAAKTQPVGPNLIAVDVPPGRHDVRLQYRNPAYQKALFGLSLCLLICWPIAAVALRTRRKRSATGW